VRTAGEDVSLKPLARVGLVAAGYGVAVVIAFAAVSVHAALTGSGRDPGGMAAFGDSLLFLAVFGVAAIPATSGALFLLRSNRGFWRPLAITALGIAATGIAAGAIYLAARVSSVFDAWSALAVLRILVAPLFGLAFFLAGVFAPSRSERIWLLIASAVEAAVFACVVFTWIVGA
jgi:hypothetical protein